MLVSVSSSVQSLYVGRVEADGGGGIFNDLLPGTKSVIAGGPVGVEDGVRLAENGLRVEVNSAVIIFTTIGLVAGVLKLQGIIPALLVGKGGDRIFVDLRQLISGLYRRSFRLLFA